MSGPSHEGEVQKRQMLRAYVHQLKGEGYSVAEIAYFNSISEDEVQKLLTMSKEDLKKEQEK